MDIILKEKEQALKYLQNGAVVNERPYEVLKILIRYYKSIHIEDIHIKNNINQFMCKYYNSYNKVKWEAKIEKIINGVDDDVYLINIDAISITHNELIKIHSLNRIKLEKLAFVLLVYAKILNKIKSENNNWVNKESKIIFKEGHISDTGKRREILIKELVDKGFIELPSRRRPDSTSVKVKYIYDDKEEISITDFRDVVMYYLQWRGDKITTCNECGIMIPVSRNGKTMYCKECGVSIDKQKAKQRMKK